MKLTLFFMSHASFEMSLGQFERRVKKNSIFLCLINGKISLVYGVLSINNNNKAKGAF